MSAPQFTEQDWRRLLARLGEDPDEETITSAMLGELLPNLALRTEFLALARAV